MPMPAALRAHLRQRLPEHMLPAAFVAVEAIPRTPSGKLDRRALPTPGSAAAARHHVPPVTAVERRLAGLMAAVLRVETVGLDDHCCERGGHSLLATQLVSRVRRVFGVELPLRRVFETPTLLGLAEAVEVALRARPEPEGIELVPVPREGMLPLSFAQQRLW